MLIPFRCHIGKTILYDTVSELNWRVDLRHHPINALIDILQEDWDPALAVGREVPVMTDEDVDCVVRAVLCFSVSTDPLPVQDCEGWEFSDNLYYGDL